MNRTAIQKVYYMGFFKPKHIRLTKEEQEIYDLLRAGGNIIAPEQLRDTLQKDPSLLESHRQIKVRQALVKKQDHLNDERQLKYETLEEEANQRANQRERKIKELTILRDSLEEQLKEKRPTE